MTIGQKVKFYREQRGLTQEQLALAVGYKGRSSINKIELDESDPPQKKILAIAEALDVSPWILLFDDADRIAPDERPVIRLFRQLNAVGKEYIFQTLLMATRNAAFTCDNDHLSNMED